MSHPTVRYTGPGSAGADFRSRTRPPDLALPDGAAATYLATQTSTGGDYGLFRWDTGEVPGGPGPPTARCPRPSTCCTQR